MQAHSHSHLLIQPIGMFLVGVRDSISPSWISKTLLYVDPLTKRVHPSSKQLFTSLKSSLIKILLYVIVVPTVFQHFDILSISSFLKILYLILTYGYLFFYNNDIMVATRKLIIWQDKRGNGQQNQVSKILKTNDKNDKIANANNNVNSGNNFQLDKIQKIQFFTLLSGQIKSFIFLLFYYVPIFMIQTKVLSNIPYLGVMLLIISESFFNGVFYFLKTWSFDSYNIGFIESKMSYMIGYGFVVSLVCNYILKGLFSTGGYLILSLWMLINSVIYSPPQIQFKSWNQVLRVLTEDRERNVLKNGYNIHRQNLRSDKDYRNNITKKIFVVYPALKITQIINNKISSIMKGNLSNNISSSTTNRYQNQQHFQNKDINSRQRTSRNLQINQQQYQQQLTKLQKLNSHSTRQSINISDSSSQNVIFNSIIREEEIQQQKQQ